MTTLRSHKFFVLILLLSITYCSRKEASDAYFHQVVDPDGIPAVENGETPKLWSGSLQVLQLEELLRIGEEEGPEEHLISTALSYVPVATGPNGQIGYIEQRPTELRVFNSDGTFAFCAGRQGEGPGEWRRARSLQYIEGTGWAIIASPYRLVMFDETGAHLDTGSIRELPGGPFPSQVRFMTAGGLWYWTQDSVRWEDYFSHLYWGNWKTIEAKEVLTTRLGFMEAQGDIGYSTRFPFSYDIDTVGRAWVNHIIDYEIEVLNPVDQTRWRIRRVYQLQRNPDHNRAFKEDEWMGDMTDGRKMVNRPPEYYPSIKGLKWVTNDELWVFTSTYVDSPFVQVDIFNPDGEYINTFKAIESLRWAQFQDDTVWQLKENEEGVPQLVCSRYRIDR